MQRAAAEGHIGLHAAALYDDACLSGELLRLDDVKGVGSCNLELVHVLHHPRQKLGATLDLNGLGAVSYTHLDVYKRQDINICSALYSPLMVREAVEMAVSVLKGEKVDPVLVIPTTIVDRSNVDEYIDQMCIRDSPHTVS